MLGVKRAFFGATYRAAFVAAILGLATACTEPNPAFVGADRCDEGERLFLQSFPVSNPDKVDIIFIVDTSNATAIANLRTNAPSITSALGGLDYRIGVTAADGNGQISSNNCQVPFVATSNTPTELECLLSVTAQDRPAAILETAVDATKKNADFLRPDARLVVLAVASQDDCSSFGGINDRNLCEWDKGRLPSVTELHAAFIDAKSDLNGIAFAVIAGPNDTTTFPQGTPPTAACTGALGPALHSPRLHAFADLMGPWGRVDSICTDSLSAALVSSLRELSVTTEARYCPAREVTLMRGVELVDGETTTAELESNIDGGFSYIGKTPQCSNGVVAVGADALTNVNANTEVNVIFCGVDTGE